MRAARQAQAASAVLGISEAGLLWEWVSYQISSFVRSFVDAAALMWDARRSAAK